MSAPGTASQTVNTTLTPNCNAQTCASFDLNDTTWVTFYYHDSIPIWRALLSIGSPQTVLEEDVGACGITLLKGLEITFNPMGNVYTVLLTGTITDAGTSYRFDGAVLGVFSRSAAMKAVVRLLRSG